MERCRLAALVVPLSRAGPQQHIDRVRRARRRRQVQGPPARGIVTDSRSPSLHQTHGPVLPATAATAGPKPRRHVVHGPGPPPISPPAPCPTCLRTTPSRYPSICCAPTPTTSGNAKGREASGPMRLGAPTTSTLEASATLSCAQQWHLPGLAGRDAVAPPRKFRASARSLGQRLPQQGIRLTQSGP